MINQFKLLLGRLPELFGKAEQQKVFANEEESERLETAICLESVLEVCYQSVAQLIHNRTIREESNHLREISRKHQADLRQGIPYSIDSELRMEKKIEEYLAHLNPSRLSLTGVINLSISMAAHKIDIYKYLVNRTKKHYFLLNHLIEDSLQEIQFLRHEKVFHQNPVPHVHLSIT